MWRAEYKNSHLVFTLNYFFYSYSPGICPVLGNVGNTVVTETFSGLLPGTHNPVEKTDTYIDSDDSE